MNAKQAFLNIVANLYFDDKISEEEMESWTSTAQHMDDDGTIHLFPNEGVRVRVVIEGD